MGGHAMGKPVGFGLTVLWILLITNAFNLIDGLDGLAVGSALLSVIVVIATSLVRYNDLVTMLSCALFGTLLGFVPFNFHPASIFMGDSGSLFIGFALGALSLNGWSGKPTVMGVAVPILCFGLPIGDVTLAVARRFLKGQPLFRADADHIHHKLLKRGFSQQHAVLLLYGVTAAFVLASTLLIREEKMLVPVLAAAGLGVCLGVRQLRYQEFSGGWLGLRAYLRRRQMARAEQCIRQASQSLERCADFRSICQVLKENLQPIGIDGIHSLQLRSARDNCTEASVFRVKPASRSHPDAQVFSDDFRITLSTAIERAAKRIEIVLPAGNDAARTLAANSLPDSA
jgi:UDP-GlcNAc:undecaprenyl-phosphate GlcNAc-1-phosphate transferase